MGNQSSRKATYGAARIAARQGQRMMQEVHGQQQPASVNAKPQHQAMHPDERQVVYVSKDDIEFITSDPELLAEFHRNPKETMKKVFHIRKDREANEQMREAEEQEKLMKQAQKNAVRQMIDRKKNPQKYAHLQQQQQLEQQQQQQQEPHPEEGGREGEGQEAETQEQKRQRMEAMMQRVDPALKAAFTPEQIMEVQGADENYISKLNLLASNIQHTTSLEGIVGRKERPPRKTAPLRTAEEQQQEDAGGPVLRKSTTDKDKEQIPGTLRHEDLSQIFALRKQDPTTWSIEKLSERFNIQPGPLKEIIDHVNSYSVVASGTDELYGFWHTPVYPEDWNKKRVRKKVVDPFIIGVDFNNVKGRYQEEVFEARQEQERMMQEQEERIRQEEEQMLKEMEEARAAAAERLRQQQRFQRPGGNHNR